MDSLFPQLDVSSWLVHEEETLGKSEKLWLRNPNDQDRPDNRWLFKPVTQHADGSVQGGDWAEKITCHIADLLEVPCAEIEMAIRAGVAGTLSRNVRPSDEWDRHTGALWMDSIPDLPYSATNARKSRRRGSASAGYKLPAIAHALKGVGSPPGCESPLDSADALDVFAGYLLLDALIANQDRHEQNWSVLRARSAGSDVRIAASYDHEGALGFQLTDAKRRRLLDSAGTAAWAARGSAVRFEHEGNGSMPSLVEFAVSATKLASPNAQTHWTEKFGLVTIEDFEEIVSRVPEMSDVKRNFVIKVLEINLERVQHGLRNIAA